MASHRLNLPPDLSMSDSEDEDAQPRPCLSKPSYYNRVESDESDADDSIVYLAQTVSAGDPAAGDGAAAAAAAAVDLGNVEMDNTNSTAAPGDARADTDSNSEGEEDAAENGGQDGGHAPPPLLNSDVLSK